MQRADQIRMVPLSKIVTKEQARKYFDEEELQGLAASMRQDGLLQPIGVVPEGDRFEIVFGERRYRAALLLGWTDIPAVMVNAPAADGQRLVVQLVENAQRSDLLPTEQSRAIAALMDATGMAAKEVAERLGMSPASVTRSRALLDLPADMQAAVDRGEVAPSAAYEWLRIGDPVKRAALAPQLTAGGLTRDAVVGATKRKKPAPPATGTQRVSARLDADRTVSVTGPSLTLEDFITTLEELTNKARKARTQNMSISTFAKMLKDQAS